jgi:hypothetical protein
MPCFPHLLSVCLLISDGAQMIALALHLVPQLLPLIGYTNLHLQMSDFLFTGALETSHQASI